MITLNMNFLNTVVLAASKEPSRYYLNGVFINDKDGFRHYTATNGHILITAKEQIIDDPLPNDLLIEFKKPLKSKIDRCQLVINEKFVTLLYATEKPESFNLIDGKFPEYERIIPKDDTPAASEFCLFAPEYLKMIKDVYGVLNCKYQMEHKHAPCLITKDKSEFKTVLMPLNF